MTLRYYSLLSPYLRISHDKLQEWSDTFRVRRSMGFGWEEEGDCSHLAHQLNKHVHYAAIPACCTKNQAWRCCPEAGPWGQGSWPPTGRCWSGTVILVKQRVQVESGRGFIGQCSSSQTLAIITITWRILETHIAGSHSQCFRFGKYEIRPQDLHFKQVPVTLMLLVQGPLF